MTIKELKEIIKDMPDDAEVMYQDFTSDWPDGTPREVECTISGAYDLETKLVLV